MYVEEKGKGPGGGCLKRDPNGRGQSEGQFDKGKGIVVGRQNMRGYQEKKWEIPRDI